MIKHTFFDKCNTILENSEYNTGLNPVAELNAGEMISRILIYIDIEPLRESVKNNEINISNLKHTIKMTNCGNINLHFCDTIVNGCKEKERACSFDIIAFKLPYRFDQGVGFHYFGDYAKESNRKVSKDGSNWFNATNKTEWDEHGVYFSETLLYDLENKYNKSDDSVIIGIQHFDSGMENLEIDITKFINDKILDGDKYYGIGLSFSPTYEMETTDNRYISFFTNHTNTFFAPYLETVNNDLVIDNRYNFHIGCDNRLYFFVTDNGEYINLDKLPKCTINDTEYVVKQNGKGIYYIDIKLTSNDVEPDTILYDIWSDIVLNGENIDDVEMEFVVLPIEKKISFGKRQNNIKIYPQLSGINASENLKIGEIRNVIVDFIEEYSHGKKIIPSLSEYRLYVKENDREIDIFNYQYIERYNDEHMFIINTNDLIPNQYHIDIRVKQGTNVTYFNNILNFNVVSNITNYYI